MKILVTGAGGFVGGAVVRLAASSGHEVLAASRRPHLGAAGATHVGLDGHDESQVAEVLARHRPEAIVHSAWSNVADRSATTPTVALADLRAATVLIEEGARHGLQRFVGLGSQAEYGRLEGRTAETRLPEPTSRYGATKLATLHLARHMCEAHGVSFAWTRLFSTYGPGDRPTWLIPSIIAELCAGRTPRTSSGEQLWDYLYIDDTAAALLILCERPDAQGVFNLGSGQPVKVRAIVEALRDLIAPGLPLVFGQIPHRPDQIWHMEADINRLRAATGWQPTIGLEEGLARTIAAARGDAAVTLP